MDKEELVGGPFGKAKNNLKVRKTVGTKLIKPEIEKVFLRERWEKSDENGGVGDSRHDN